VLYIVLVLVLAALGLLVFALITASSLWAWVSIGLSVLAGLILVADWLRRRRRSAPRAEPAPAKPASEEAVSEEPAAEEPVSEEPSAEQPPAEAEQTVLIPAAGDLGDPADTPEPEAPAELAAAEVPAETQAEPEPETDPGEEETTAADIAVLADLEDEVVVVDEHPRYHLTTCVWLGTRDTIPIGIGEARQLGFTPCDRCRPDANLVSAHR
jgi:septal ring-binding cell division protein DamX